MTIEQAHKYRLLIIDDDKGFAQFQATFLEGHNYDVRVAYNGKQALQIDTEFQPQLALIDFILEKENGIDVLDALTGQNREIRCLMITAQAEIESTLLALRHGAVDCLNKSIKTNELLDALKRAAEKLRLQQEKNAAEGETRQRAAELLKVNQRLQKEISSRTHAEVTARNAMKELEAAQSALQKANDELEAKVKERTDELAYKNMQYNILVENAADGIFIHDEQGQIFEINQSGLANLGYSAEEIKSLTIFDIEVDATPKELLALWAACEPGKAISVDGAQQRKDGSHFPVNVKVTSFTKNDKKYLLAIARDVTERKAVETALRESEVKLRTILDSTAEGILVVDNISGKVLHSNYRFMQMWHIPKELIERGDDEAILQCGVSQLADPGSFYKLVQELYNSDRESTDLLEFTDGRIFERYTGPLRQVSDTKLDGRIWVFRDITTQKQIEEDLQLYRLMVESTSDPMFVIDSESARMIYVNEAAVRHYGASKEEVLAWRIPDWDPNFTDTEMPEHLASIQKNPGMLIETEHRVKGGQLVPVEISLNLTEYKGRLCHFGFFHNIAERKQKEKELLEAKLEADRANKAKSEFLARMSHELRTPMNAILGFGQILQLDDENLNDEQRVGVGHIMDAGRHLLQLINEVLDISKVDAGEMTLEIKCMSFNDVLSRALLLVQPLAPKYNVMLESFDSILCCSLMADEQRLKQVLLNLLSNAIKYNRKGGKVSVHCCFQDSGHTKNGKAMVRVSVTDTGIGIREEDFVNVFEPFQRVISRGENIEGSGVGLTITKKMVEHMGGRIGFESEYDKGSTFWFELPACDECDIGEQGKLSDKEVLMSMEDDLQATKTILYIEDDPTNRTLIQKYWRKILLIAYCWQIQLSVALILPNNTSQI